MKMKKKKTKTWWKRTDMDCVGSIQDIKVTWVCSELAATQKSQKQMEGNGTGRNLQK